MYLQIFLTLDFHIFRYEDDEEYASWSDLFGPETTSRRRHSERTCAIYFKSVAFGADL
jgi:hypothetical protein